MTTIGDPIQLPCGATLVNRIAKAAMSEQLADPGGAPSRALERVYARWAEGGAGLLITGNVMVDARHLGEPGNVVVEDDRHRDALARWADAARGSATQIWVQINHPGRQTPRSLDPAPVAPSAVAMAVGGGTFARPRALDDAEIREVIARFARTSAEVARAGFDGVQVHAAHGYLVSQFLSPRTNLRDDDWGGDAVRRRRFLIEILRAIRAEVPARFAVSLKLNSADFQRGGITKDETIAVIEALADEGVDLLEISGGTYERAVMFAEKAPASSSTQAREAFFLDFAEQARAVTELPLMLTGGFRSRAAMDETLGAGAIDVVGMARPLAVEPELARALIEGTSAAAVEVELSTGWKLIDSVIVGSWYQRQIQRVGEGLEPELELSRVRAVLGMVKGAVFGSRVRRGL